MTAAAPIFLSHGSPMLLLQKTAAKSFLAGLGADLGKPKAVVAVTAHWTTDVPQVGGAARPETIHDFYGFPPALYAMRYDAKGDPALAAHVAGLIGPDTLIDAHRGLDHGIWQVASLIWPDADVPIIPLSVQPDQSPAHHYEIGRRLRPLAEDGVLVVASGGLTHNLRAYMRHDGSGRAEPWAQGFADWMEEKAREGALADLLDYRAKAPFGAENHPTDEHLLPFYVALGASADGRAEPLFRDIEYGVIAMDAYRFH
jgi:4,5-DOPA dioxygenase extradiol